MKTKLTIILSLIAAIHAYASTSTWNLDSGTNEWYLATNWTPASIPNGANDTAIFGASNTTNVFNSHLIDW
jgi:hypothetical protein